MESGSYSMKSISLIANGLSKEFNRSAVFKDITFSLSSPASLSITGKNGAGKSTLLKILAGVLSSTHGYLTYSVNEKQIAAEEFKQYLGFVSPYLNLYDEFTAWENLQFLSRIRSARHQETERGKELLSLVGLWNRRDDRVGAFSSGMKQRLKYAFALLHDPAVLILDEPSSNLDTEGIEVIKHIILEQKEKHIVIIATNSREEARWCDRELTIGMLQ
jgi:heme exporter protein A